MDSSSLSNQTFNLRAGKWELRVQPGSDTPANPTLHTVGSGVVTGIRSQGSKGWLKPTDGRKWLNAVADVNRILTDVTLTFAS